MFESEPTFIEKQNMEDMMKNVQIPARLVAVFNIDIVSGPSMNEETKFKL